MENDQEPVSYPADPFTGEVIETAPHPAPSYGIFIGRFGLRAGWGMAIFILVFVILTFIGGILAVASMHRLHDIMAARMYAKAHPGAPAPHVTLPFAPKLPFVSDAVQFLGMLIMCWVFSKAERRRFAAYGIGARRWPEIFQGLFWGILVMSALVGVLHSIHVLVFDGRALYGSIAYIYGAKWLLAFLLVGFAEEYSFRGYLQYTLMRGFWGLAEKISPTNPRPWAFALSGFIWSLLFACAHLSNGGENFFGLVQVFMAGVVFVYALWRTGSLWWGIGMHMTWDWAQSFLFGVADSGNISVGRLFITHPQGKPLLSGGADGPEGSIFATVMLVLLLFVIRFTARPGMQPSIEQEPKPTQPSLVPEFHTPVA